MNLMIFPLTEVYFLGFSWRLKERKRKEKRQKACLGRPARDPAPKCIQIPFQHDFMLKWIFAIATSP